MGAQWPEDSSVNMRKCIALALAITIGEMLTLSPKPIHYLIKVSSNSKP